MWLVPALPIAGAAVCGLFGRALGRGNVSLVASGAVAGSFLLSCGVFLSLWYAAEGHPLFSETIVRTGFSWIHVGDLALDFTFVADRLSAVFLLVITGVGLLIHIYSAGYMSHDPGYWRYFAYLNLFVGAMLILVLADSLPLLFMGWEGVGLCSYLLIGFWYTDTEKAIAGKKAFIVNRVGDFGVLLGIFILFGLFGTVSFSELNGAAAGVDTAATIPQAAFFGGWTYGAVLTLAMGLIFFGCTGKSAQIPLFVWLPDAMAGPTPVSALIHAATMVTAGIYLLARLSPVLVKAPSILVLVAVIGAATAVVGAFMGLFQRGIKKVLAYSTVSQLGYMFLGVGVGAFYAGVFHVFTHAFFKACLFLCAGSVMHALHDEEDIHRMGGLAKVMPTTHWTFLVATLAITGTLPLSGFWSKDTILHEALVRELGGPALGWTLWGLGTLGAVMTAVYMWRLYFLVFRGEPRAMELHDHAHESPPSMTIPLQILAVLSVLALIFGLPHELHLPSFSEWLAPVTAGDVIPKAESSFATELPFLLVAWAVGLFGFFFARAFWGRRGPAADAYFKEKLGPIFSASYHKLWWDEVYMALIVRPLVALSKVLWWVVDVVLIDRFLVEGIARQARWDARQLRRLQNGDAQRYAAVVAIGAALLLAAIVGARTFGHETRVARAEPAPLAAGKEVR
ncbi:MAG: NADH-quinone oxidoreductase subunit L [Deltaproteobacteria bacterium]|nr:MAG: NADH-quinone oxidoreductase subunit L [Deltaproteobacteria bacterium]